MRVIWYLVNLTHKSLVDSYQGTEGLPPPEDARKKLEVIAADTGDTFCLAVGRLFAQGGGKPRGEAEALPLVWASESTAKQAFDAWWNASNKQEQAPAQLSVDEVAEQAFRAGAAWAAGKTASRRGSALRGRVVTAYRLLTPEELKREEPSIDLSTHWPVIELDDGTLVYAAKPSGTDADGKATFAPALLCGQKEINGKVERATFNLYVRDVEVKR